MATRTYTKADVETHRDNFGPQRPAVNVKIRGWIGDVRLPLDLGRVSEDGGETWQDVRTDARFTHEWISEHVSPETLDFLFGQACSDGFERLNEEAREIFGAGVEVWAEGRSGGWAVVSGLGDVEDWDAPMLAKWRRFEKFARAERDDVLRQVVESVYINEFEAWAAEPAQWAMRPLRRGKMA